MGGGSATGVTLLEASSWIDAPRTVTGPDGETYCVAGRDRSDHASHFRLIEDISIDFDAIGQRKNYDTLATKPRG